MRATWAFVAGMALISIAPSNARAKPCQTEACRRDRGVAELPPFRQWRLELSPFGGAMVGDPDEISSVLGVTSRIYVHNRLGIGLEGALYQRHPLAQAAERAEVRTQRMALGLHLSWVAASGALGPDGSTVADFYLLGGGGIISAQQNAEDPTKPRLDFTEMATIGAGSRFFFTSWLGLVAEARGNAIFDGGLDAPTPAFEGRLGLTTFWPPTRLDHVEL